MGTDRGAEGHDKGGLAPQDAGEPVHEIGDVVGVAVADRPPFDPVPSMIFDVAEQFGDGR
jgi:hypothetical protein